MVIWVWTFKFEISCQFTSILGEFLLLPVVHRVLLPIEVIHLPGVVTGSNLFRWVRGRNIRVRRNVRFWVNIML